MNARGRIPGEKRLFAINNYGGAKKGEVYRVTVPKDLAQAFIAKHGPNVHWVMEKDRLILLPMKVKS